MSMKSIKAIAKVVLICHMLLLTGCWGSMELREVNLVTVLGIDSAPDGEVEVTVLVSVPVGNAMSQQTKSSVWIGRAKGNSLEQALNHLNATSSKALIWYHTQVIILGAEAAKTLIKEFSDLNARNREMRFSQSVLITEGKASELLDSPANVLDSLSQEIEGMMRNTREWSKAYASTVSDFLSAVSNENADALAGRISRVMTASNTSSVNRQSMQSAYWQDREYGLVYTEGSSVIKNGRFVGFLDADQTRGCLWIINKVKKGIISAQIDEEMVSLEYRVAKAEMKPEVSGDGKITMNIKLRIKGSLSSSSDDKSPLSLADTKDMEAAFEDAVRHELAQAVEKLQKDYAADALGFGCVIKEKHPKLWKTIKADWEDIFPNIEVRYDVNVLLRRFGTTTESIIKNDS